MRRAARIDENQPAKFEKFGVWSCRTCGKQEPATAHQKRKTYCSNSCMAEDYKTRFSGTENPNHTGAGIRECERCGKEYHSYNKARRFCSLACANPPMPPKQVEFRFRMARLRTGHIPLIKDCEQCGTTFRYSPSQGHRKYCGYQCFLDSGGAQRAGDAAVKAKRIIGPKKDANHDEIFSILKEKLHVHDLSPQGFGCPDGCAWVNRRWTLFDVKNPKTSYGRRGLNKRQRQWANDWQGGPVYLIHTKKEARFFAHGCLAEIQRYPE